MHDYKWHKVSEMLPDKCGIYDVKIKICRYGSTITNVIEWRYTSHEV